MASVMTLESLKELGLRKGNHVEVVVKAVNVPLMASWVAIVPGIRRARALFRGA